VTLQKNAQQRRGVLGATFVEKQYTVSYNCWAAGRGKPRIAL